ncbi:pyrroline-5-carboxylate reductase [Paenibacillus sp. J5C_2022]|uniref:pyrroline-5-carboxylate reductase n=1 Tax=Paenibacillus sp. J5C2022 TaxID=2977129 RepID=UPI0021D23D27|nr:pyrroline-5-carboxylate reductase [Paenibacillus sp. J5C2022]MCU6708301.1 pyrroline-5-carboxylate reductase [Paenibacillus sp. J5C2022]
MSTLTQGSIASMQICFYGAGSMAEAIARGVISNELIQADRITMLNRSNEDRLAELHQQYGVRTKLQGCSHEGSLREADIIFLAMKPKDAAEALDELKPLLSPRQLVVSVIAGLSIASMEQLLGGDQPIVRAMPNTSSTIGLGATGISYSTAVSEQQRGIAEAIFQSIGIITVVAESLQSAITGVSGSGPAYVYAFMEAMMQGASELGLTEDAARELVIQTVLGAAQMARTTGEHPAELRRKVTSPNGTTEAALRVMAEGQLAHTVVSGMRRSADRADELGEAIERSIAQ